MSRIKQTLIPSILLVSAFIAYAATAPTDDAELARSLIGTWTNDPADKAEFIGTVTYNADGTGTQSVRLREQPENTSVRLTTHWSIKDGILSLKSVTSSDPQRIPVGLELKDRIISISKDRFVFESYAGYGGKAKREVRIRQKAINSVR